MKKTTIFSITGLCVLVLAVFAVFLYSEFIDSSDSPIKKVGSIKAELEVFGFEESVQKADVIVKVRINKNINEFNEPSPKTLYSAEVLEILKWDTSSNKDVINVLQQGNSEWSFNNNAMFIEGDEFILFLKNTTSGIYGPNSYWILGEETNMYKVLGNGGIEKLAKFDPELSDIEDKKMTESIQKNNLESNIEKDVQVLNENLFKNKIIELNKD